MHAQCTNTLLHNCLYLCQTLEKWCYSPFCWLQTSPSNTIISSAIHCIQHNILHNITMGRQIDKLRFCIGWNVSQFWLSTWFAYSCKRQKEILKFSSVKYRSKSEAINSSIIAYVCMWRCNTWQLDRWPTMENFPITLIF